RHRFPRVRDTGRIFPEGFLQGACCSHRHRRSESVVFLWLRSLRRDPAEANQPRTPAGRNPLRVICSLLVNVYELQGSRHALSQVTNHAPSKPRSIPSSGLDTANQNGITSLNGIVSPSTFAV